MNSSALNQFGNVFFILRKHFINIYITYYLHTANSTAAVISLQFIKLIGQKLLFFMSKFKKRIQKQQRHSQTLQHF